MENCAFCNDVPESRTIHKDDMVRVFPTYIPITEGHTLVCPHRCVPTIKDITEDELLALYEAIIRVRRMLQEVYGAEGFNVVWNEGKLAGQSVPHLHIHVIPRKEGDNGLQEFDIRSYLYRTGEREPTPEAELEEVARKLAF